MPDFGARGSGGVREPNQGNTEYAKVGVNEGDGFVDANLRVRSVELPLGPRRIADGDPGAANAIEVAGKALDGARFEIQRIVGEKDLITGLALDSESAVNVLKKAVTGADVVVRLGSFEMLVAVIENDMASGDGFVGLVVVLDMVGAKARAGVTDVDVAVGRSDVSLPGLRSGFKFGDQALAGSRANFLGRDRV